jgi:DNA invertase Pin-like site-specific DNA recombinase
MIADSAKRQFQAVLVYQLDRFARNRYDSATYKSKLKKNGVKVLSARENITDDASGILMEAVLEGMAEYFSAELSQKIKRGMELNAEKCLCVGASTSLGYDIDENKRYVVNESEAAIVRRIYEMYLNGSTMADIIRYLNENQIKTSLGNPYNKNSIRLILTNKRYCGIYYLQSEIPDGIPRIIDDTVFADAQILLEKNKKAPARTKAIDDYYILTTTLFCGYCQAAMTGVSGTARDGTSHQYYKCVAKRRNNGYKKQTLRKAYIENKVIEETVRILTPEYIDMLARSIEERCEKERNTENLKRINKLIKENETATKN